MARRRACSGRLETNDQAHPGYNRRLQYPALVSHQRSSCVSWRFRLFRTLRSARVAAADNASSISPSFCSIRSAIFRGPPASFSVMPFPFSDPASAATQRAEVRWLLSSIRHAHRHRSLHHSVRPTPRRRRGADTGSGPCWRGIGTTIPDASEPGNAVLRACSPAAPGSVRSR